MPVKPLQTVCSFKCAGMYATEQRIKQEANLKRIERKKTKEALDGIKTKSEWLKDAQRWFNKWIRIRDENEPCISCGRNHQGQYHCGHYRSIGSSPHLRFDEKNCNKQCAPCNNHLSGNAIRYREGLIRKIGSEELQKLESDQTPKHYTIDDIKEIKAKYKNLCYELEKVAK